MVLDYLTCLLTVVVVVVVVVVVAGAGSAALPTRLFPKSTRMPRNNFFKKIHKFINFEGT